MSKRAIISVGVGGWYPRGLRRLKQSLEDVGFDGTFLGWDDCYPPGSPTHQEVPDAFEAYAFQHALDQGHTSILWLDAAAWAIKKPDPIFDIMEAEGAYMVHDGWKVGQWCKDSALPTLRMTREEAMAIETMYGAVLGVDYTNPRGKAFLDEFMRICMDGETLKGYFPGGGGLPPLPGQVSDDPRVLGHAHEQTVASALRHHHGFKLHLHSLFWLFSSQPWPAEAVVISGGM